MNINRLNSGMSWVSMFLLMWFFAMGWLDVTVKTTVIFSFFLVVAVFSGAAIRVDLDKSKQTKKN